MTNSGRNRTDPTGRHPRIDMRGGYIDNARMAQTLTDIKNLLALHGLHPRKRHGQNFLHDGNQMRKILHAAAIAPGDLVLEVGPGTGALTEHLLEAGACVVAVEIDAALEPILNQRLAPWREQFTLILGDALAGKHRLNPQVLQMLAERGRARSTAQPSACKPAPSAHLISEPQTPPAPPPFKLIANLPYNIASPLLLNLVMDVPAMVQAVVMVQREVADRMLATPGGKDYGLLSVLLQALCHVQRIATLSPGCFWPAPAVASAVVDLRRREQPLTDDPAKLAQLCQRLFQKRRKQIGTILGRSTALPDAIRPDARPEQLSIEQLIRLARITEPDRKSDSHNEQV